MDVHNAQVQRAARNFHVHNIADGLAQQGSANRGFGGNTAFVGVGFVRARAHDAVLELRARVGVLVADGDAHGHTVGGQLALVNDFRVFNQRLQAGDFRFVLRLIVARFRVFSVFRQVAEAAGNFDGVDDFLAFDIQQVIVALLQFLQRFRCHDIMFLFFCHMGLLLSYRGINRKEAPEGDASAIPGARGLWDSFHYTCFFRVCQSKKCWNVGFNRV